MQIRKALWNFGLTSTALVALAAGGWTGLAPACANAAVQEPVASSLILDPTAMDPTVSPCQDFYQYACGNWLARTTIPSDQSTWDRSFSVVYEQNLRTLRNVLTDYSQGHLVPNTPYARKLGEFYASCMNEDAVEKATQPAISAALAEVDQLQSRGDLPALIAKLQLKGMNVLFSFGPTADLKDPTIYTGEIDQGGMGLPNSPYYTKKDDKSVKLRQEYVEHIKKMFELAGYSTADATKAAADVMAVESALAQHALPPEDLQDPAPLYHPSNLAALEALVPDFNWSAYFSDLGISAPKVINLTEAKFLGEVETLVKTTDLPRLRNYLKWHVLESIAPMLGKKVYAEYFRFNGEILSGKKAPAARWKRCVSAVSYGMSEALGQAFVAKTFSAHAKQRAKDMIAHLREAFQQDLSNLPWLDAKTRAAALEKLSLLQQKIGYPDHWRNYDGLKVSADSYLDNTVNADVFETRYDLAKIGGKVDPMEWGMSPQTVNAYYDPSENNINFPAGILQPPFFSDAANDASNYGAIGMVIGHEMTHGFDTSGSQFDGHGAQKDWWTPGVKKLFEQKASCLEDQYSSYTALPGLNVNGKLTITENIADQGGLKLAFAAYKLARASKPAEAPVAGLNADQQFFVSMAQMWCEKQTDQALRNQVLSDPHSPARFRVIGPMVNDPDFANAFSCAPGTPMAPAHRCSIW